MRRDRQENSCMAAMLTSRDVAVALAMPGKRFPETQFVVTGVPGPQSNAHGSNQFLHLPTARRITATVAHVLHSGGHTHTSDITP